MVISERQKAGGLLQRGTRKTIRQQWMGKTLQWRPPVKLMTSAASWGQTNSKASAVQLTARPDPFDAPTQGRNPGEQHGVWRRSYSEGPRPYTDLTPPHYKNTVPKWVGTESHPPLKHRKYQQTNLWDKNLKSD